MPVTNFEDITHNVTPQERLLLSKLHLILQVGTAAAPVTGAQIARQLGTNGARVRKLINLVRTESDNSKMLIATSKGYFWTENVHEMKKYQLSLRNRYNEIRRVEYHIRKVLDKYETTPANQEENTTQKKHEANTPQQGWLFD